MTIGVHLRLQPNAVTGIIENEMHTSAARVTSPLVVRAWSRAPRRGLPAVSASIGGFDVEFCGAALDQAPERADAFLAISLLPAMARHSELDLRDLPPVSATLVEHLKLIQDIWATWNSQLHRVTVRCNVAADALPRGDRATFFSGGIDALYAAMVGGAPNERLVFINGFDFDADPEKFQRATARVVRLADRLEMRLETIETNWIHFTRHHRLARLTTFGSCLGGIAHLLAPGQMTIASSYSWEHLAPTGSHPLLDPLWSTTSTRIRLLGTDATRAEKTAAIAQRPDLLQDLWVCFETPEGNCGRCSKCVRTRAMLYLLDGDQGGFPATLGNPVKRFGQIARKGMERGFLPEMVGLAQAGGHTDLVKTLHRAQRSVLRRDVLRRGVAALPIVAAVRRRLLAQIDLRPWGLGPDPVH